VSLAPLILLPGLLCDRRPFEPQTVALARLGPVASAGRQDALMPPPAQEEMAAAISDATLAILPRCGHLAPLERADMVTRLLRDWWPA
jgi:hypothetical protein